MSATWEKKEGNEGVLTFEVSKERFDEALDVAFKKVVKDIEIPGFRKGRVPRMIFEQRFGVESLYQDAVDDMLNEAYNKAIDETGITPVDQPEVDIEQIEKGKPVIFTATVTVKPEVELGDYKGLEVEKEEVTVTDDDVEAELSKLQEEQAELVVKEEGTVESGDTVVMDFEGYKDGEKFDGGSAENHTLEVGSGQFIPGFEDQLIGKPAGESFDVEVTFPEDYQAEDLAGQDATFKVVIHDIKYKEVPELDDEFAKDVDDEVETLDELKKKTREKLEEEMKTEVENQQREVLINQASENSTIDLPEAMVNNELDRMLQEFEQNLQMQGLSLEMYTQMSGQSEDDLKDTMKEDAEKRVRTSLTLEAIAEEEKLEASDEDVEKQLQTMAEQYQMELDQLKQILGDSTEGLKGDLKLQKAIDFLYENAKFVEPKEEVVEDSPNEAETEESNEDKDE